VVDYSELDNRLAAIHESTVELATFISSCEPMRMMCGRTVWRVGAAEHRAAVLLSSLKS
jgi:hypothetical protein